MKSDKQCASCPDNCETCDRNGVCSKCKNGKISADGLCTCSTNCQSCAKIGWGQCDICSPPYKLTVDRVCVKPGNGN